MRVRLLHWRVKVKLIGPDIVMFHGRLWVVVFSRA